MKKNGFTLVELSIVLLVISLFLGVITIGKSMISSSKIVSVISEVNQYRTAVSQFNSLYNALPGDISNASTFWPNCTSASGDGGSCNGNSDGTIGISGAPGWTTNYNNNENLRAWQHLSLSKLISGNYSGFGYGNVSNGKLGINTPSSKYPNSGYSFFSDRCYNTGGNYVYLTLSNIITTATLSDTTGYNYPYSIVPSDAYNLDKKIDDGNPKTGNVISRSSDINENCGLLSTAAACVNGSSSMYYTSNNNTVCMIYFSF